MLLNSALLFPLLVEEFFLYGHTSAAELIKIFTTKILERGSEAASNKSDSKGEDKSGKDDDMMINTEYRKDVTHHETDAIAADYDNVMDFL